MSIYGLYMWLGQWKWTKLAQTTHHHKNFYILGPIQYIVICKLLPIKLFIDGRKIMSIPSICYNATKLKKMVKFYVPTWALSAGQLVIYIAT